MRSFPIMAAAVFILVCGISGPSGVQAQSGYDRPGGDYLSFPVRAGDPAACAASCERDSRCRAWSFSYPHTAVDRAVCWLKNKVTPPVKNDCCVSGVRGAAVVEPKDGAVEYSIDRLGGDYREAPVVADPDGKTCQMACEADGRCRAWTYVRPGYIGASARCFLKSQIKPPRRKPCCISGVVR
ncbi:MAG: PAN domain-containing protein [Pseudorhodoplanes sp.]|nr:PAN domain-containing protein [Pseudorhodoplanes sp.]